MGSCTGCNSLSILTGTQGEQGVQGEAGVNGVGILDRDTTSYSNASSASWEALAWSYTIPADTLAANEDEILWVVSAKAGDASIGVFDEFRLKLNGTALTNPVASYIGSSTATFRCPYTASETLEIQCKIIRLSATTARIFLYLIANNGASRVDLYATSTAVNNLDSATNSLALEVWGADTVGSINVYDIVVYKASV